MRVVVFSSSRNLSGGLRQAFYLARGLAQAGVDARMAVRHDCELFDIADGFPLIGLPGEPDTWRDPLEALLLAPGGGPGSVAHAFHNRAVKRLTRWGLTWRRRGIITVAHRGVCHWPGNPLTYWLPGIDSFTPNSEACAKVLARIGTPRRRLTVIDNGIPPERVMPRRPRSEVRAELGATDGELLIGTVLNDNPLKGLDVLLTAFAQTELPQTRLAVVGARHPRWPARLEELGIADRVRLVGTVEHVADYLAAYDLFVFPSQGKQDSQPNALIEAMLAGVPVVSSDVGGTADVLGGAGLMVPQGDAQALADALTRAASDAELRARMAADGLTAADRFRLSTRIHRMLELYARLAERRGLPVPHVRSAKRAV